MRSGRRSQGMVACLALGTFLYSGGLAAGTTHRVSIRLNGFSVPNMWVFPGPGRSEYSLGAVADGRSSEATISTSPGAFGLNFLGLSGENVYATFQTEADGKISFVGWQSGGEGLICHINGKVSPPALVLGPLEALIRAKIIDFENLCFFADALNPHNYILKESAHMNGKPVASVSPAIWSKGTVIKDYDLGERPGAGDKPTVDSSGTVTLEYGFTTNDVFESRFVRIPVRVAKCHTIRMEVDSDGSENNLFVIVQDGSGEKHLALKTGLGWRGWRPVGMDLTEFSRSSLYMQRSIIHWGGDENQILDFPITAVEVGVAKHGKRNKDAGKVKFRHVRFVE